MAFSVLAGELPTLGSNPIGAGRTAVLGLEPKVAGDDFGVDIRMPDAECDCERVAEHYFELPMEGLGRIGLRCWDGL